MTDDIDTAVAKAMGWVKVYADWFDGPTPGIAKQTGFSWKKDQQSLQNGPIFRPSTDWGNCGVFIEYLRGQDFNLISSDGDGDLDAFKLRFDTFEKYGPELNLPVTPDAICRAGVAALGVQI